MRDHSISMIHTGKGVRSSRQEYRCHQSFWRVWSRLLLPRVEPSQERRTREGIPCSQTEQIVLSKRQRKKLPAKKNVLQGVKRASACLPNQPGACRDVPIGCASRIQDWRGWHGCQLSLQCWICMEAPVASATGCPLKKPWGGWSSLSAGRQPKS